MSMQSMEAFSSAPQNHKFSMLQKPSNVHHSMHVARLWSIEMHACTWHNIMPRVAQYVKYNKA